MRKRTLAAALAALASSVALLVGTAWADDFNVSIPTFEARAAAAPPQRPMQASPRDNGALYAWLAGYWYIGASPRSDQWLLALGQCEQGSDWAVHGPTYEGHFGMMAGLWDRVRRPEWPDNMGDADYAQQMAGVRAAHGIHGDGAWGCADEAWRAVPGG